MNNAIKKGFTLVELAIVLIIIGLLVGGILGGQELIHQSQLRKVIRDFNNYQLSVTTFESKYAGLPGDFIRATNYFSGTANGNGDKKFAETGEGLLFFQHLGLANLIAGTYTGVIGSGYVAGTNLPQAGMEGQIACIPGDDAALAGMYFQLINGERLMAIGTIGEEDGIGLGTICFAPSFLPEDAYSIDLKMDDGRASAGSVLGYVAEGSLGGTSGFNCQVYDPSVQTKDCTLAYKLN